jgi:hypothetical protein
LKTGCGYVGRMLRIMLAAIVVLAAFVVHAARVPLF